MNPSPTSHAILRQIEMIVISMHANRPFHTEPLRPAVHLIVLHGLSAYKHGRSRDPLELPRSRLRPTFKPHYVPLGGAISLRSPGQNSASVACVEAPEQYLPLRCRHCQHHRNITGMIISIIATAPYEASSHLNSRGRIQ